MITPEKLTKNKLSKLLVRKHKKFLKEHRKEFEALSSIIIIKEKQDLLEYWLNSSQTPQQENKYLKKLKEADEELEGLKKEFTSFSEGNSKDDTYLKNRHKWLKEKIQAEEKAIPYWQERSRKNG